MSNKTWIRTLQITFAENFLILTKQRTLTLLCSNTFDEIEYM